MAKSSEQWVGGAGRFGTIEGDLQEQSGAWGDVPSTTDRDESRPWTGRPDARTRSPGMTTLAAVRLFYGKSTGGVSPAVIWPRRRAANTCNYRSYILSRPKDTKEKKSPVQKNKTCETNKVNFSSVYVSMKSIIWLFSYVIIVLISGTREV